MLHDVGNNRDCDVDVDHRNNTSDMKLQQPVDRSHVRHPLSVK